MVAGTSISWHATRTLDRSATAPFWFPPCRATADLVTPLVQLCTSPSSTASEAAPDRAAVRSRVADATSAVTLVRSPAVVRLSSFERASILVVEDSWALVCRNWLRVDAIWFWLRSSRVRTWTSSTTAATSRATTTTTRPPATSRRPRRRGPI